MRYPYCINTDRVLVFGRWISRMAVHNAPRGISFYGWRYFHEFCIEWVKFGGQVFHAWLRGEKLKAGE